MRPGNRRVAALLLAAALTATACGSGDPPAPAPAPATAPSPSGPLTGVCPDPVVVQTDWFAEAEYGGYFRLLGDSPVFDTAQKRVSGPLVDRGSPAGVHLEIRYGGPAIGFQQVTAQMHTDLSITLGLISTDEAVQNSAELGTLAVLAPLETSPLMIMWDRTRQPDVRTIADLGRAGTPVLYYQADTYMQYLLGSGQLRPEQVDGSYDGSPARWVSSDGAVAQGGFATAEPYIYRTELGAGRDYDIDLQLISETGYPIYGQALSIRAGERADLAPCLRELVPMVQRAWVDFMADPGPTTEVIVAAVQAEQTSVWSYSPGLADYAVRTMRELGIVGNGPNATLGDLDPARVQRMIEILTPVFAGQNLPVRDGLTPEQLMTNEFVDPSVGLPG
ncbi:MAG TPA: ABC transporter substrate-binding protein [Pseudonocardia sp.]|nr:ABC transporter substrate-binding protein [Pseudonocardia sp.]